MASDLNPDIPPCAAPQIPPELRKHGLVRVTDNIAPDQQLAVRGGLIWTFFSEELKARFVRKGDAATDARSPGSP